MILEVKFLKDIADNINSTCAVLSALCPENTVTFDPEELCCLTQSLERFKVLIEQLNSKKQ